MAAPAQTGQLNSRGASHRRRGWCHVSPLATLTEIQVRDAGIEDWDAILGRIRARFCTGYFATGEPVDATGQVPPCGYLNRG